MLNQPLSWESIRQYILQSSAFLEKPRTAVTGWADGSLSTADRPNYIKVRFYDDSSEVEVYNESVPLVLGLQIHVYKGYDGSLRAKHPTRNYQVKDLWFSFIKNHGANHSLYSVDPIYVQTRSFLPLQPYVSGAWSISIRPGWMVFGDQSYWFAGETLSVKDHRPTLGARFVLLTAGVEYVEGVKTVKIIVTPGPDKNNPVSPDDFPKIPEGTVPICAVRASRKRIKLQDKQDDGDIHDLRLSAGGGGSGGGPHDISDSAIHGSTIAAGKLLKADVHGLPIDSDYSDADITVVHRRLEFHTEPIIFNGELLFCNGDIIVMEVLN